MSRLRLLSEYEAAVLSTLRFRAWWKRPMPEAEIIRTTQLYAKCPARTVRHHLRRFTDAGLIVHDDAGYRWNADAPPERVEFLEAAAKAEGLTLAPLRLTEPVGPFR